VSIGSGSSPAIVSGPLHSRIQALEERVYLLEEALRELQAEISDEPHPLLLVDDQTVGQDPRSTSDSAADSNSNEQQRREELIESLGSLSIVDENSSRFYGPGLTLEVRETMCHYV
jgi:hypothetical protein